MEFIHYTSCPACTCKGAAEFYTDNGEIVNLHCPRCGYEEDMPTKQRFG